MLRKTVWLCLAVLCLPTAARAQSAREIVARGKAATAFVEVLEKKSFATAVCIHRTGIFITNQHVVKGLAKNSVLKLIFNPNATDRREVLAGVIREDADTDLAVLRVDGSYQDQPFEFVPLGRDNELWETMSVTAFGFPFGKVLAVKGQKYPDISVNLGRITSLRQREGKLHLVQLDAQLNPGNSGGPVLDESGSLIGIVQSGVYATGVNFAMPVSRLRSLLQRPDVVIQIPPIAADEERQGVEVQVELVPFLRTVHEAVVEIELRAPGTTAQTFTAQAVGGNRFALAGIELPPATGAVNYRLLVSLQGEELVRQEGMLSFSSAAQTARNPEPASPQGSIPLSKPAAEKQPLIQNF